MARPIVFLSDYGLQDAFVGICHGVMSRMSPDSRIIDLTHGIPPQDVVRGAVVLGESMLYMPKDSVFLAVVDPGVGTSRQSVAVEDEAGFLTVGPDNGLLSLAWVGGPARAVEISSPDAVLAPVSPTFHGRDVFAPAAAMLARGASLQDLGPEVPVSSLVRLEAPRPEIQGEWVRCLVVAIDRFGNAQLSVRAEDAEDLGLDRSSRIIASVGGSRMAVRRVATFGDLDDGEYGVLVDSAGSLAVVRNGASAAEGLGLESGDEILLRRTKA